MGFTLLRISGDLVLSGDLSHTEDLWKAAFNPMGEGLKHKKYCRGEEREREQRFWALTHTHTLSHAHRNTHLYSRLSAGCGGKNQHRYLPLCVPERPLGWQRESGCLATSHLHGLPNHQGQDPFRLRKLCCARQRKLVASDTQSDTDIGWLSSRLESLHNLRSLKV